METIIKSKNILLLLLFLILLLSVETCVDKNTYENQANQIAELLDKEKVLKKKIDEQGREITGTKSIVLEQNSVIEKQLKEINELKQLSSQIKVKNRTIYDTLQIVLNDTIIVQKNDSLITKKFRFKDKWLIVDGYLHKNAVKFDSLAVNNEFTIETGKERIGFLKYQTSVFIRNENPHTSTKELQSIVINEKKKWYQKSGWKIGLGLVGGYLIGKR